MRRDEIREPRFSRRRLLVNSALLAGGAVLGVRGAGAEEAKLVTEFPENQPLIDTLKYVNQSTVEGRNCANCILYQGGEAPRGKCPLFQQGVVPAAGWCASWALKP